MVPKTATSTETKTITRIIHYVDKVTNQNVKEDVVQPVTLSRTKTENKVTGVVTYGEWTTGNWDEVISGKIDKYKDPDIPTVESQEVTSDSSDKEITVRYDRLSTPDKPTPENQKFQVLRNQVLQVNRLQKNQSHNQIQSIQVFRHQTQNYQIKRLQHQINQLQNQVLQKLKLQ
ncbi:cell wall surface anchor family protein [Streptococcus pneumoniae]|nr:cell wall surface anchor family protein [Streptococcus pneumoniae]VOS73815.1 cell wall surface anchor family protein [Streptococcus pneumoniae]